MIGGIFFEGLLVFLGGWSYLVFGLNFLRYLRCIIIFLKCKVCYVLLFNYFVFVE